MVRALSMPRPAYIAAHSPAGPAPTMITSYPSLAVSFIGPQFSVRPPQLQPRRFGIAGKRSLELRTKPNRFDLDIGSLPARQLFERAPAHRRHPMGVPALLMEQRGRRLDQTLPDACRRGVAVTNYRTPDGFQGLVGEPILPGVEQVASAGDVRSADFGSHRRHEAAEGGRGGKETPTAAPCRPLPPRSAASSAPRGSSRSSPPTPPPPSRSRPRPAAAPSDRARRRPSPTSARSRWPGR